MALSRLFGYLKSTFPQTIQQTKIKKLQGQILAIDTSSIIYKSFLNQSMMKAGPKHQDMMGNKTAHIITLMTRSLLCMKNNIRPIWVLDGVIPIEKFREDVNRSSYKSKIFQKIEEALDSGQYDKALHYQKNNKKLSDIQKFYAIRLLELLGYPVIQAPTQALSQCVYFSKKKHVDAVVSQDLNCLPLGCQSMLKSFKEKTIEHINYQILLDQIGINPSQFTDLCILLGSSYSCTISGIGPSTGLNLIKKYNNIQTIIKELKIPTSKFRYEAKKFNYERARQLFKNPNVLKLQQKPIFNKPKIHELRQFLTNLNFKQKRIEGWMKNIQKYNK